VKVAITALVAVIILVTSLIFYLQCPCFSEETNQFLAKVLCENSANDIENIAKEYFYPLEIIDGREYSLFIDTNEDMITVYYYNDNTLRNVDVKRKVNETFESLINLTSPFYRKIYCDDELKEEIRIRRIEKENEEYLNKASEFQQEWENRRTMGDLPKKQKAPYNPGIN
jgi:hypothetical protein